MQNDVDKESFQLLDVELHAHSSLLLGYYFGYGCISYAHARLDKIQTLQQMANALIMVK